MRIQIQHRLQTDTGVISQEAYFLDGKVVDIGRGSDQHIQLNNRRVDLAQLSLNIQSDGSVVFNSKTQNAIKVDKRHLRSGSIADGSIIYLPGYELHIKFGGEDAELSITVEQQPAESGEARYSPANENLSLAETWLGKRRTSWLLFAGILLISLAFPLVERFGLPQSMTQQPVVEQWVTGLQNASWTPDHSQWISGEISTSHQGFADNCQECHVKPFTPVDQPACLTCHEDVAQHTVNTANGLNIANDMNCASCHAEHNGSSLILATEQQCTDCHSNMAEATFHFSDMPNVSDFATDHPSFSVERRRYTDGEWIGLTQPLSATTSTEQSNLTFPHQLHLSESGINSPIGQQVLECSDCHKPSRDAAQFEPIEMESHCQSCHSLAFDPDFPSIEAPHKSISEVTATIDAWYQRKVQSGFSPQSQASSIRPGQSGTAASHVDSRAQAKSVAISLIERQSCVTCHELNKPSEEISSWSITPVYLPNKWFSTTSFDHQPHKAASCNDCHQAQTSTQSADILIPDIKACIDCHGDESVRDDTPALSSSCLDCHQFHSHEQP